MIHKFFPSILLVLATLMSGCVIQPVHPVAGQTILPGMAGEAGVTNAGASAEQPIAAYTLKPNDPIYVRFSGIQEQGDLNLVIDEKGEINLLHIENPIMAAGLTTSQLERQIERLYIDGGIYKNVSVTVTMTAKAYYVQGEVNAPGKFQLTGGTTLVQAIAEARGPTPFASKKVTITRQGRIYTFDRKDLEEHPEKDVKIEAGDVIKVWQSWY